MKQYKHFSLEEREYIEDERKKWVKPYKIADAMGRSRWSVYREINRNATVTPKSKNGLKEKKKEDYVYRAGRADTKYRERKKLLWWRPPLKNIRVKNYVIEKLKIGWSPDIIAGTLTIEYPDDTIVRISHECIYQFIYSKEWRELWLKECLLRAHTRRRKHTGRKTKRTLIPNRKDISERPPEIEKREEIGHWEGDSIVGVGKWAALHTEVERLSRFMIVKKMPRKTAECVKEAMILCFQSLPKELRKTDALDNGAEHTKHEEVTEMLGITIFFAKPYHSWERWTNENGNGMMRRYFPKKTNFDTIPDEEIQRVVDLINNRPRKILWYLSAAQVFNKYIKT